MIIKASISLVTREINCPSGRQSVQILNLKQNNFWDNYKNDLCRINIRKCFYIFRHLGLKYEKKLSEQIDVKM